MKHKIERILYRPSEAFEAAGVGRSTGYALVASGEWPSIRIGKAIRIPAEALHEWIELKIASSQRDKIAENARSETMGSARRKN